MRDKALEPRLFTLHPTPYTLRPTPYALHPTPYTLTPTPTTLSDAVIVKASSGPRYVVGVRTKLDKEKLVNGTRVVPATPCCPVDPKPGTRLAP